MDNMEEEELSGHERFMENLESILEYQRMLFEACVEAVRSKGGRDLFRDILKRSEESVDFDGMRPKKTKFSYTHEEIKGFFKGEVEYDYTALDKSVHEMSLAFFSTQYKYGDGCLEFSFTFSPHVTSMCYPSDESAEFILREVALYSLTSRHPELKNHFHLIIK